MAELQALKAAEQRRHWGGLRTDWPERTVLAAQWLQNERTILDVGCGRMTLETLLPASSNYIPLDIVPRDHRTMVVDLNRTNLPEIDCDAVVMLGVLEYVDDLANLLRQCNLFPRAVLSYNHISINDILWAMRLRSKKVTWANRYTIAAFRRLLRDSGLNILRERKVRLGERLYEVAPTSSAK